MTLFPSVYPISVANSQLQLAENKKPANPIWINQFVIIVIINQVIFKLQLVLKSSFFTTIRKWNTSIIIYKGICALILVYCYYSQDQGNFTILMPLRRLFIIG